MVTCSKVSKIQKVKKPNTKVYDIEVPKNSNFVLSNGLVVHNCEPYQYFKNVIYEERMKMFDSELLTTEILGLERNSNGVINHPDEGRSGSKDLSDAICGATWNASFYAEQFTFEYGENIETMISVNEELTRANLAQQITVDFETEMQNAFKLMQQDASTNDASQLDFGMGPSIPIYEGLLSDGILLW